METHRSARKHGISDDAISHAFDNALVQLDFDADEHPPPLRRTPRPPWRQLMKRITSNGGLVTDDEIQKLADQAEAGIDVSQLKRRPGRPALGNAPAEVFPVRLEPELRSALRERAESDHTPASDIVRAALRAYLQVA
jgi:hypothetical protein